MQREAIHCPKVPRPVMGSHAVKAGDFVFLGGQIPSDYKNGLAPEVKNNSRGVSNPVDLSKIQSDYILKNARAILKSAGSSFKNGVRIDQFVTRPEAASPYLDTRKRFVPPSIRPASTHVAIEALAVPDALVGLELIAVTDAGAARKRIIDMEGVPKSPGGPFAGGPQAVAAGDFIFLTGQIASDFKTGIVPEARKDPGFWYGSAIGLQTEYVLKRLQMVLEEAESSLDHVVKADVWLMDMEDVREFDEVWKEYFPKNPPARSLLPVSRIADAECLIEINLIAVREGGKAKKKSVMARGVPAPGGHQPHAVRAGDFLFLSGIFAADDGREIAPQARIHPDMPWFGAAGRRQTEHILSQMEKICQAGGSRLADVVWTQNFYTDFSEFDASREVWERVFPKAPPAALVCGVRPPQWVRGCTIQMDAVAIVAR